LFEIIVLVKVYFVNVFLSKKGEKEKFT